MGEVSAEAVRGWLRELCAHPDRHVGGEGNRAAAELFEQVARDAGFTVETTELECVEWRRGESMLHLAGEALPLKTGPYSLQYRGSAPLAEASTLEQLAAGSFAGTILLLHGDLVRGQLMPKRYPFYNPESHRRIVAAIEGSGAAAVIGATGRDPQLAGGGYPFALVDDGDFEVPHAYLTDAEGERLLAHVGETVELSIDSERLAARAPQLVARMVGSGRGRLVFFAHIDSKDGSPGALDNASGVAVLLGMMGLLYGYDGGPSLEVVPLNGEDYYGATGQLHWLRENEGRLDDVLLGLNVDGAGFRAERTAVSLYGVDDAKAARLRKAIARHGFAEGPQWPQGDHSILVMHGVPALAVTSENVFFIGSTVAHTDRDTPELVDPKAVAEVARFFADVAMELGASA